MQHALKTLPGKIKKKFRKKLREMLLDVAYSFSDRLPSAIRNQRGIRTLVYHSVCKENALKLNARFLTEAQFEQHLIALKTCFNPISFEAYKQKKISSGKLNVLLTFDDGLKNNLTLALPLLVKHKVPAVFFVTALKNRQHYLFSDLLDVFSLIGPPEIEINGIRFVKKKRYIHYRYLNSEGQLLGNFFHHTTEEERNKIIQQIFAYVPPQRFAIYNIYLDLMSEEEIRSAADSGYISFGTHGSSHCDFTDLDSVELERELKESKRWIETLTGKSCDLVAFPYGNYDQATLKLCSASGYAYVFGTEKLERPEDRSQVIERFTVNPFISAINQMYYIAKNKYDD